MKRELERTEVLKPFDIGVGELKLLWDRMLAMFDRSQKSNGSIHLSLPNETLRFDSFDELTAYGSVAGKVTNFTVRMSQGDRVISLNAGGLFISRATVKVEGDSDVWCAGAIEAVQGVVRNHIVWYSWFGRIPFFSMIFFSTVLLFSLNNFSPSIIKETPPSVGYPVLSIYIAMMFLAFIKEKIAPKATITFTRELSWVREYGTEIGIVLGVVSIIISVMGVWISIK